MRKNYASAFLLLLTLGVGGAVANPLIAILTSTQTGDADIVQKIQANLPFATIDVVRVDTATPSLAFLSTYQSVLVVGGDPFQSATNLGNVLADYLDLGRGLVVATMSNVTGQQLAGRYATGNYWAITAGGGITGQAQLGTVVSPGHPVMAGVTSFDGGSLSLRADAGWGTGAMQIATWSDGRPLAAARTFASGGLEVALNFYPVSGDVWAGLWDPNTDGDLLLANALAWTANYTPPAEEPEPGTEWLIGGGMVLLTLVLRARH